jgi:hypothetical protein
MGLYGAATNHWDMSVRAEAEGTFDGFWETLAFIVNALVFLYAGAGVVNFMIRWGGGGGRGKGGEEGRLELLAWQWVKGRLHASGMASWTASIHQLQGCMMCRYSGCCQECPTTPSIHFFPSSSCLAPHLHTRTTGPS